MGVGNRCQEVRGEENRVGKGQACGWRKWRTSVEWDRGWYGERSSGYSEGGVGGKVMCRGGSELLWRRHDSGGTAPENHQLEPPPPLKAEGGGV
jgi:hypothetical protein